MRTILVASPSCLYPAAAALADDPVQVFRGATVLTGDRGEIADADLVVRGGKIVAVGKRDEVDVPDGAGSRRSRARSIIPGLVDTHSHIGIFPRPGVPAHSDGNEMTGPVQPGLRALDAIWPDDPGIRMALAGGVTTANIMPGSGNVIGGQTLYVKLRGRTDRGDAGHRRQRPRRPQDGQRREPQARTARKSQAPGTRMKLAALQREQFVKARDYQRKWDAYRKAKAEEQGKAAAARDATWPWSRSSRCWNASAPSTSTATGPTT